MEKESYYEVVEGNENRFCRVDTVAGFYEGVFLKSANPGNDLLMCIRPTGKTREFLTYIATEDGRSCKDKIGVLVESIISIEFAS